MDGFITSQILLSFTGCVAIVIALTQLFKKFSSLDSKILALIFSIIIGISRIIVARETTFIEIFMGLLNIFSILCGAMGGYDAMIKPKSSTSIDLSKEVLQDVENLIENLNTESTSNTSSTSQEEQVFTDVDTKNDSNA